MKPALVVVIAHSAIVFGRRFHLNPEKTTLTAMWILTICFASFPFMGESESVLVTKSVSWACCNRPLFPYFSGGLTHHESHFAIGHKWIPVSRRFPGLPTAWAASGNGMVQHVLVWEAPRVAAMFSPQADAYSRAWDWWIPNKTFKISHGTC